MKKRYRKLWSLLLVFSLLFSFGVSYSLPLGNETEAEATESDFVDLSQDEIVEAMAPGWNLGNQMEANTNGTPDEDGWTHVMVTERMIRTIKRAGFNSIRIPVSYLSLIGPAPNYTIDQTWLNRVQEIVDWAMTYNLYVVINIHGDGYSTVTNGWLRPDVADQDTIKAKYEAVWKQIAEKFKDYDQRLIMESMNEIGANLTEEADICAAYENINDYNQIFVDTVRQTGSNNAKRWLLIPGWNTNIDYTAGDYGFEIPSDDYLSSDIPEGEKRIMVSVHYYDPWAFCGEQSYDITQWGAEASKNKTVGYQQEDYMEEQFDTMKKKFVDQGYPVVIGEWGAIDKTRQFSAEGDSQNNTFRAYYAWKICSLSVKNSFVPMYWDNGWNGEFGFAIFDRTTYEVTQPEILEAILSCYSQSEGTATAITLDKKIMELDLADSKQSLQAVLTPTDSTDTITWSSSDESVAKVTYKGNVTPAGIGTCLITATVPGGASDYCIVRVTQPKSFKAGLYANNSNDWNTLECDDYLTVSEDGGGTYEISLSGSYDQMSKLNTFFLKDVTVQRDVSKESVLKSAEFTVDSISFNGHVCTMSQNDFSYEKSSDSLYPDICMLNQWWTQVNVIDSLTLNSTNNTGYSFPADWYDTEGTNTITMKVTVKNAVLEKDSSQQIAITGLTLSKNAFEIKPGGNWKITAGISPSNATEQIVWFSENPKIATVDKDGVVTGVTEGETTVHALTISGMDVTCKVTVDKDAEEPSPEPDDSSSPAPGNNNNNNNNNTSPSPLTSPNTTGSSDSQNTALKKGSLFTAGKLKYKVTNATSGKVAVAVKAPKNKKAKSLTVPATVKKNGVTYKVTSIAANAFKNCKKLKKITIGKNVASIGKNAFLNAKALKKITVKSTKLKSVGKNALKGVHKKCVVKTPKKKLKKYKKLFRKKGQKKTVKINS